MGFRMWFKHHRATTKPLIAVRIQENPFYIPVEVQRANDSSLYKRQWNSPIDVLAPAVPTEGVSQKLDSLTVKEVRCRWDQRMWRRELHGTCNNGHIHFTLTDSYDVDDEVFPSTFMKNLNNVT